MTISMLITLLLAGICAGLDVSSCDCGFADPSSSNVYTEAIIVYFNETNEVPAHDFIVEDYQHAYERGWNSIYRQAADPTHVNIGQSPQSWIYNNLSIQLMVSPPTKEHVVVGGGIKTARRDIQYGLFEGFIRGPQPGLDGSAMSMRMEYNRTESWEVAMMNTNNDSISYMCMMTHDEFAGRQIGLNYTTLLNDTLTNFTSSPWDFVDLSVSWGKKKIDFFYNGIPSRSLLAEDDDGGFPTTPGQVFFKHWSVGDSYTMQGPPIADSIAEVAWIRMFFNSSLTTTEEHRSFDGRCIGAQQCSTSDHSLRGSSVYSPKATQAWKEEPDAYVLKAWSITVATLSTTLFVMLIGNVLLQKWLNSSRQLFRSSKYREHVPDPYLTDLSTTAVGSSENDSRQASFTSTRSYATQSRHSHNQRTSIRSDGLPPSIRLVENDAAEELGEALRPSCSAVSSMSGQTKQDRASDGVNMEHAAVDEETLIRTFSVSPALVDILISRQIESPTVVQAVSGRRMVNSKQRVDYMAGLTTLCAICVTMQHFCLTFAPAVVMSPGTDVHYESDLWARATIFPFLLNEIWLGLFFTASCRFLIERYLKEPDLVNIASKAVGRVPRLMIPVTGMVLLEYFLMDCGILNWLVYLPSVTWSAWPYTGVYANFAECVSEIIEMMYLVMPGFPHITFNYCTGVLWTIPPTIAGSWTTLLGAIVVMEVKRPYKRFLLYTLSILTNWYAQNWGAYFWAGLMLADMEVTYHYRKHLSKKRWCKGLVVIVTLSIAVLMSSVDLVTIWTNISIVDLEAGIHPDALTGLAIMQADPLKAPQYYEPRGTGLIYAVALQVAVENSGFLQMLISNRVFMWLFPHSFTMYLLHGMIWWSLGSFACIHLSVIGVPYWANLIITATACYGVLFLALPILTPPLEVLGKSLTQVIWASAHEPPLKKQPTLHPFPRSLLADASEDKERKKPEEGETMVGWRIPVSKPTVGGHEVDEESC